ncbi:MAG: hypothetical protein RLZZ323_510 [Bacteroidota bacterium]|jgi:hypothetical protein
MFLNYLKNFFLKYTLKNKWQEVSSLATTDTIKTVGLLIDETAFSEKESLIQELISNGFVESNITVIVYSEAINKKENPSRYTFNSDVLNWNAEITDTVVSQFIQTEFDLLVSYYETEKAILLLITNNSKARFKVGFSSIDKRLHHLTITTRIKNHTIFVQELCKYLKILNKIES